jgi:hypothetical protein
VTRIVVAPLKAPPAAANVAEDLRCLQRYADFVEGNDVGLERDYFRADQRLPVAFQRLWSCSRLSVTTRNRIGFPLLVLKKLSLFDVGL